MVREGGVTLPNATEGNVPRDANGSKTKPETKLPAMATERRSEIPEVGGSSPSPRAISKIKPLQFRWREPLGHQHCPYARRTILNLWLFSIRLHEWYRSDDKRHFHDHPWHFATIVLRGSYVDVSESGRDALTRWSVRFRKATHAHYVEVPVSGCVTLLVTTYKIREWGFWVKEQFRRPLKYFHKWGHVPCDEQ